MVSLYVSFNITFIFFDIHLEEKITIIFIKLAGVYYNLSNKQTLNNL